MQSEFKEVLSRNETSANKHYCSSVAAADIVDYGNLKIENVMAKF